MSYPIFRQIQVWNTGKMCRIGVPYWKMKYMKSDGFGLSSAPFFGKPCRSCSFLWLVSSPVGAVSRQVSWCRVSWSMCSTAFRRRRDFRGFSSLILTDHVNDFLSSFVAGWSDTSIWTYIKINKDNYMYVWLCMIMYVYVCIIYI